MVNFYIPYREIKSLADADDGNPELKKDLHPHLQKIHFKDLSGPNDDRLKKAIHRQVVNYVNRTHQSAKTRRAALQNFKILEIKYALAIYAMRQGPSPGFIPIALIMEGGRDLFRAFRR